MIKGLRAAGKHAGVSYETIRKWMDYGLPYVKENGVTYFDPCSLAPFIEARKVRILAEEAWRSLKK